MTGQTSLLVEVRREDNDNLVRKYSRVGELPGSFLPRTAFGAGVEPHEFIGTRGIHAAGDKVVVAEYH
jgi:hypothetical protein